MLIARLFQVWHDERPYNDSIGNKFYKWWRCQLTSNGSTMDRLTIQLRQVAPFNLVIRNSIMEN